MDEQTYSQLHYLHKARQFALFKIGDSHGSDEEMYLWQAISKSVEEKIQSYPNGDKYPHERGLRAGKKMTEDPTEAPVYW